MTWKTYLKPDEEKRLDQLLDARQILLEKVYAKDHAEISRLRSRCEARRRRERESKAKAAT